MRSAPAPPYVLMIWALRHGSPTVGPSRGPFSSRRSGSPRGRNRDAGRTRAVSPTSRGVSTRGRDAPAVRPPSGPHPRLARAPDDVGKRAPLLEHLPERLRVVGTAGGRFQQARERLSAAEPFRAGLAPGERRDDLVAERDVLVGHRVDDHRAEAEPARLETVVAIDEVQVRVRAPGGIVA